jgi:transposase
MRAEDQQQQAMFSYISPEARVAKNHPLRPIRIMLDKPLDDLAPLFKEMYSHTRRTSIPPEQLQRALLRQVFYSIRSERQFVEQLEYKSAVSLIRGTLHGRQGLESFGLF